MRGWRNRIAKISVEWKILQKFCKTGAGALALQAIGSDVHVLSCLVSFIGSDLIHTSLCGTIGFETDIPRRGESPDREIQYFRVRKILGFSYFDNPVFQRQKKHVISKPENQTFLNQKSPNQKKTEICELRMFEEGSF